MAKGWHQWTVLSYVYIICRTTSKVYKEIHSKILAKSKEILIENVQVTHRKAEKEKKNTENKKKVADLSLNISIIPWNVNYIIHYLREIGRVD